MDSSSLIYPLLLQWARQSPVLLAYLAGVVLALTYWQRRQSAAVLVLCAMVLLGLITLSLPVASFSLFRLQVELHWTIKQFGFMSSVISVVWSTGQAVGVGLLLAAVFRQRFVPVTNAPSNLPPPPLP